MDQITQLTAEINTLRKVLIEKENELRVLKQRQATDLLTTEPEQRTSKVVYNYKQLPRWAIERYSRQILLPEIGVSGQARICEARVLVAGAGGLGCIAAALLVGAGVGTVGLVDYDTVDISNLHRQILHSEDQAGVPKVESAAQALRRLNSNVSIKSHNLQLTSNNALDILKQYDVVLDCSDNVPTRYLLNDACVMLKIPLISGSALKLEGQLTVYNYRRTEDNCVGPCLRCIFPLPPPAAAAGSCAALGVAAPLPNTIGALQALEAMKFLVGMPSDKLLVSRLLVMDGEDCTFRVVKLRQRNPNCAVCGTCPTITSLIDYEQFCGAKAVEKDLDLTILTSEHRSDTSRLSRSLRSERHLLVDVRSEHEFNMCRIDGAINYPIERLDVEKEFDKLMDDVRNSNEVTFVCRRGNDSQIVAAKVLNNLEECHRSKVKDLVGGLHSWAKNEDPQFPVY